MIINIWMMITPMIIVMIKLLGSIIPHLILVGTLYYQI